MKAGIVTSLRSQYDLKELLKSLRLPRATYYDRLKRNRKADKYAEETIRRLMSDMGLKVTIYSKHTSKYHSYKGRGGKVAPNILKQQFDAKRPFTVLHTDVTQVRLYNGGWGYISRLPTRLVGKFSPPLSAHHQIRR
ncbi:hypothetical protein PESHB4_15930 [Pediococcus ethanolidurans]